MREENKEWVTEAKKVGEVKGAKKVKKARNVKVTKEEKGTKDAKEKSRAKQKGESSSTIFDDAFRTMQQKMPWLLIPIINDAFGKNYPLDTEVKRLPERYETLVSKRIVDSCSLIGNRVYHLEAQSHKDGTMILRILEYDFMIGLASATKEEGEFTIPFPKSCVIYVRHDKNTPDYERANLLLPDDRVVKYLVPTIKLQNYGLDEIFEKKLYAYLPFYLMRYEKEFKAWEKDEDKIDSLQKECEGMLSRLSREFGGKPEEFLNMLSVTQRIVDYITREQECLRERMDEVMGGKIWELPSDRIREEKATERAAGKTEGKAEDILDLLSDLGEVPQELKDELYAEKDVQELKRLLKLAAKARSIEEFCEKKDSVLL